MNIGRQNIVCNEYTLYSLNTPYIIYCLHVYVGANPKKKEQHRLKPKSMTSKKEHATINMHTHKHTYMHPCIHTYMHTYTYLLVYMYMYIQVHMYAYTLVYVCVYVGMRIRIRHSIRICKKEINYVYVPIRKRILYT